VLLSAGGAEGVPFAHPFHVSSGDLIEKSPSASEHPSKWLGMESIAHEPDGIGVIAADELGEDKKTSTGEHKTCDGPRGTMLTSRASVHSSSLLKFRG